MAVTGAGEPVGRMLDKSGNGNHAVQAIAASRPVLQQSGGRSYLQFDGVDDYMETPAIDVTGDPNLTMFAGFTRSGGADRQDLFTQSAASTSGLGLTLTETQDIFRAGDGSTYREVAVDGLSQPRTRVLTGVADFSVPSRRVRSNLTSVTSTAGLTGVPPLATRKWFIGATGTTGAALGYYLTGRIYQLVMVHGRALSSAEIERTERHIASKSGVTL
jgi:hypothetical protein